MESVENVGIVVIVVLKAIRVSREKKDIVVIVVNLLFGKDLGNVKMNIKEMMLYIFADHLILQ